MKLFLRGGMSLAAMLFAAFLIFYARPLLAETTPSQGLVQQEQQKKQESAGTTQQKQTEPQSNQPETGDVVAATVSSTPTVAVKEMDDTAATSVAIVNSTKDSPAAVATTTPPLTAPQGYTAFSYSLCCRGSSGLGVRRGTIAADPRVLPYGTRVRLTGGGSYDGEYLVTDAGTAIKGNKIDVWVPTIHEARRFGRRNVRLIVLSYGGKKAKGKN
jgi:3D (Asp-Asp-Asp) domain-containing protein